MAKTWTVTPTTPTVGVDNVPTTLTHEETLLLMSQLVEGVGYATALRNATAGDVSYRLAA